jgi:hypothetical protein
MLRAFRDQRMMRLRLVFIGALLFAIQGSRAEEPPNALRIGRAGHAFDHLGNIGQQAEAAAASGATIIYASGLGSFGYQGLPTQDQLAQEKARISAYNRNAEQRGIEIVVGYLCATSIVGLDTFDQNWSADFRGGFRSPPDQWLQQDRQGRPLPSWYGGEYRPACMNHPDWRAYESFLVRQSLESGHKAIFFDNPTVHPQGCYCEHCMRKFAAYLGEAGVVDEESSASSDIESLRKLTEVHPRQFLKFRSTIGGDFLRHMRSYARCLDPEALITCNNSLNSPDRFFSQCRDYGYNIHELSQSEDFVVVEDMATQPRVEPAGRTTEYGPTYKCLHAISHGKPIVAVTLAGGDYHTPPNLVRLAMAEAAAHQAAYLSWPTWPEAERRRMIAAVRPQTDFLREHESLLNDVTPRADVLVYLPFHRWLDTDQCAAMRLAAELTDENIQYRVASEDNLNDVASANGPSVLLHESGFNPTPKEAAVIAAIQAAGARVVTADEDWLTQVKGAIGAPSIVVEGPSTVRAVVADQTGKTIVHLLNLNVERLSSFTNKVTPAMDLRLAVETPFTNVGKASIYTADEAATIGEVKFSAKRQPGGAIVELTVPRVDVSAIVVIEEAASLSP